MMNTLINKKNCYIPIAKNSFVPLLLGRLLVVVSMAVPHMTFGFEAEKHSPVAQAEHTNQADSRWSYHGFQGPRFWGFLEDAYKECRVGHQQSPIDVVMPDPLDHQEVLAFDYGEMPFEAIATEHGIQFRTSGDSRLLFNGQSYRLKQFHFHDPSEHHIDGKSFPLEMHFVHKDPSGHFLVVALLFTEGKSNEPLAAILKPELHPHQLRTVHHDKRSLVTFTFNVRDIFPQNSHHFSYLGSLTTPPCTQGVRWIIMRTPLQLSPSQLVRLKALYGVNARPVQPLYNRDVYGY